MVIAWMFGVFFTNIYRLKVDFKEQHKYFQKINDYKDLAEGIIREYLLSSEVTRCQQI
jgi:hypothetical protein